MVTPVKPPTVSAKAGPHTSLQLATPLENDNFDEEYKLVDQDIQSIQSICEAADKPIQTVTQEEVKKKNAELSY